MPGHSSDRAIALVGAAATILDNKRTTNPGRIAAAMFLRVQLNNVCNSASSSASIE
jgi:hypothetical protein